MEFFDDRDRSEDPGDFSARLAAAIAEAGAAAPGPLRHGALAACLSRAGALAQALADAADAARAGGPDAAEYRAPARAAMGLTARLAAALWRSWRDGGRSPVPALRLRAPLLRPPPAPLAIRTPEGYAIYGLYPETYALAARALAGEPGLVVVGVRSIGTSLGAAVAAGAGAARPPITVRPVGHPHARRLGDSPALARAVARRPAGPYAIVDEGPGLSGSSFASVARALLARGVPERAIHLFPSHPWCPGARASADTRALLARLPSHHVPFHDAFLAPGPLSVGALFEDVIGPASVEAELTGGAWRPLLFGGGPLPPSQGWLERRKFLLRAGGRRYVARFAGIGAGEKEKLERAMALTEAGVGVRPVALRHGFLLVPWAHGARPLASARPPRAALLEAVRRTMRVSAARPRLATDGASPAILAAVARVNAAEALGPEAGEAARRLEDLLPDVAREAAPVEVDGKPHAWEWLALPDGRIVKTDGLDHHAGYELSGCQDALWDVAGAEAELGLTGREALALAEAAREAGPGADPRLLPFYRVAYRAVEVGRWTYALANERPGEERDRREAALARARAGLGEALAALARGSAATRAARGPAAADGGAAG